MVPHFHVPQVHVSHFSVPDNTKAWFPAKRCIARKMLAYILTQAILAMRALCENFTQRKHRKTPGPCAKFNATQLAPTSRGVNQV